MATVAEHARRLAAFRLCQTLYPRVSEEQARERLFFLIYLPIRSPYRQFALSAVISTLDALLLRRAQATITHRLAYFAYTRLLLTHCSRKRSERANKQVECGEGSASPSQRWATMVPDLALHGRAPREVLCLLAGKPQSFPPLL
jgi:hypothetical protein